MASGTCGENLTWTLTDGTLVISGTGDIDDAQNFFDPINELIEQVIVEEGATSIGDFVFSFCADLKSVALPDSLSKVGIGAFNFCESLTEIKIPANVSEIGKAAFCGCWSLKEITLPEKISALGENVFFNCAGLQAIKIPAGVRELGGSVFKGCESLTSVTLPDGLTKIGAGAFEGCESLTEIKIPASVVEVGEGVFNFCSSLEKIFCAANFGFEKILSTGNNAQLIPTINEPTTSETTWHLDGDTLTIISADKLKSLSHDENAPWYDRRESIKKIIISHAVRPLALAMGI